MKKKISNLEAERLAACRAELSLSKKIMRALQSRRINFSRLDQLHVEYLAAILRIGNVEERLHRLRVEHELAEFIRAFFLPAPSATTTT
jgi:hypothetical protein